MSGYVEVTAQNEIITYPYTFSNLQAENPYTNFGGNQDVAFWFPQTDAAIKLGYQLLPVFDAPQPEYNDITQYVVPGTLEFLSGKWYSTWIVMDNDPERQAYVDAQHKEANKQQASLLLSDTDWTSIPSVADPSQSNPYLANQAEFLEYRNKVRAIAINPPVVVEVWPIEPEAVWETVS